MKIITVTQQKGGTGKTTTAAAIGAGLIRRGQRVLYVDLDPQGNLSYIMGATGNIKTACELFNGTPAKDVLYQLASDKLPGLEGNGAIIPASAFLSGADATLTGKGRERRLALALAPIASRFDYCIIDTPPALGILTVNALTAADSVIIPCLADIFSIQATGQISQTINGIKASSNPQLKIAGILLTRYTARQNLTKDIAEILEDAAEQIGTRLFNTRIRESVSIRESQAMGQDVFSYNPHSNGAKDYQSLIEEIF
jgi:chromosome partitioning protein